MDRLTRLITCLLSTLLVGCGPKRLEAGPCMSVEEVERLSDGFDVDDLDPPGRLGENHDTTRRWDHIQLRLDDQTVIAFDDRVAATASYNGKIGEVRLEPNPLYPIQDLDLHVGDLVRKLEAAGFSVSHGHRDRFLSPSTTRDYRALDLRRGDKKFSMGLVTYGRYFDLKLSATDDRCRSPEFLKWQAEHAHVHDELYDY